MDLLPPPQERDAILDALAAAIVASGFEAFVAAPLLEPSARFFPEPWERSARGARALALRLLRYAGRPDLDVVMARDAAPAASKVDAPAALWFVALDDTACTLGVRETALQDAEAEAGPLCRAVARAYRQWHGHAHAHERANEGGAYRASPTAKEGEPDDEAIDLTTICLGFGILTTNAAYRFRKTSPIVGMRYKTTISTSHTGASSAQAMAFALAAQVVARGLANREANHVGSLLEPNQEAYYSAARSLLEKDTARLTARLGLPSRDRWPAPRPVDTSPLREDARFDARTRAGDEKPRAPRNEGASVFRVRTRWARVLLGFGGGFVGLFVGAVTSVAVEVRSPWLANASAVVLALAAAAYGRRFEVDRCSDPDCATALPRGLEACPRCGGRIRGVIARARQRLAAEEALEDGPKSRGVAS
jgi:hypothetical protein